MCTRFETLQVLDKITWPNSHDALSSGSKTIWGTTSGYYSTAMYNVALVHERAFVRTLIKMAWRGTHFALEYSSHYKLGEY